MACSFSRTLGKKEIVMEQQQLLFDFSSIATTAALFVFIILFNEIGFRIGRFVQGRTDIEIKTLTGAIQPSILGLLALLLGFSFSMSMQRKEACLCCEKTIMIDQKFPNYILSYDFIEYIKLPDKSLEMD